MSSFYASPPNTPSSKRVGKNGGLVRQNEYFSTRASNYAPLTPPRTPPTRTTFSPLTPPTTPLKHRTLSPPTTTLKAFSKNGDLAVVKTIPNVAPMAPAALKILLGLSSGKCGSPTKNKGNPPCKNKNPSNIDTQIKSMTALAQSSRELPDQLEKLAVLALCVHHIKPECKDPRVRRWKSAFPVGDEKAVPVEPIEDQIKSVLDCFPYASSYTCIGAKRDTTPCNFPLAGKRVLKGKRAVALIIKPENYSHDDNLAFLIRVLACNMFCYNHTEQISEWVTQRKSRITAIYRAYPVQDRPLSLTGVTRSSRNFKGNPAEFGDNADDTSAFVTELEKDRPLNHLACYSLIRKKMTEPLKQQELKSGYVYIYEVDGNKGFLKIGFTTQKIEERSAQWKFQCDRAPKVLYPIGPTEKIPHANRVEGLCLAELKYRNATVVCEACPKRHIEWVQAPIADVVAVVRKWTAWVCTAPFEDSKRKLTRWELDGKITSWGLRDEEARRTNNMPKLMQEIAAASLPNKRLR